MTTVLAIDPGREKCGLAVVTPETTLFRAIVPTAEIGLTCHYLLARHPGSVVLIGDATTSDAVSTAVRATCPQATIQTVPEAYSTLQARRRYECDYPPRGVRRLIPAGMRVPPRPVDDYAAVILAETYLAQQA